LDEPSPYVIVALVVAASLAAGAFISVTVGIAIEFLGILYFLEDIRRTRKRTRTLKKSRADKGTIAGQRES